MPNSKLSPANVDTLSGVLTRGLLSAAEESANGIILEIILSKAINVLTGHLAVQAALSGPMALKFLVICRAVKLPEECTLY